MRGELGRDAERRQSRVILGQSEAQTRESHDEKAL